MATCYFPCNGIPQGVAFINGTHSPCLSYIQGVVKSPTKRHVHPLCQEIFCCIKCLEVWLLFEDFNSKVGLEEAKEQCTEYVRKSIGIVPRNIREARVIGWPLYGKDNPLGRQAVNPGLLKGQEGGKCLRRNPPAFRLTPKVKCPTTSGEQHQDGRRKQNSEDVRGTMSADQFTQWCTKKKEEFAECYPMTANDWEALITAQLMEAGGADLSETEIRLGIDSILRSVPKTPASQGSGWDTLDT